jgi:hypothetical protein
MNTLDLLPITAPHKFQHDDAMRLRGWLQDPVQTEDRNGILHWTSNGNPVPLSTFKEAFAVAPAGQAEACQANTDAFLAEYRAQDHTPSREDLFEMRAAFGAGATVVNVITGKRTRL